MADISDQEMPAVDAVHIWTIGLGQSSLDLPELLSNDEISRFSVISHNEARCHFLRSRTSLRLILASYLRCNAADIVFRYNDNGKPEISFPASPPLRFNLSHSGDYCLLAVAAENEVGVDVEQVQTARDYLALAHRFYTQSEFHLLQNTDDESLFYKIWVLKEASVKARGMKLLAGLDRFRCSVSDDGELNVADKQAQGDAGNWSVRQWQPDAGSIAAVVVRCADVEFVQKTLTN